MFNQIRWKRKVCVGAANERRGQVVTDTVLDRRMIVSFCVLLVGCVCGPSRVFAELFLKK